jgi:large subunit ribosomal protein L16
LLLRPRKFIFKNRRKIRNPFIRPRNTGLIFGDTGLQLLQPLNITAKRLFRIKMQVKKGSRRVDKTSRKVWLNAFPHLPLTKKTAGSRMGKGKGKLKSWFSQTPPSITFVEYKNLRIGRSNYFLKQLSHRLPVRSRVIHLYPNLNVSLPANCSKSIKYQPFN